jgi:PPOX class probable F420-dependent enzyme
VARKDVSMTNGEVLDFLAAPRTLIVTTNGPAGFPHVAPMWYLLIDGKIGFRSFSKSQKIVNLRRDPKLTVLAEEGSTYGALKGVMISGTATLIDDRDVVLDWYGRLAARYPFFGTKPAPIPDAETLEQAFGPYADKNTAVLVEPAGIVSWDHTKLGGAY